MVAAHLALAARLDLPAADPLAQEISAFSGTDLTLDARDVDHFGALAVQVLRAAAKTWAAEGRTLALTNASADVADQLNLLGFTPTTVTAWEDVS